MGFLYGNLRDSTSKPEFGGNGVFYRGGRLMGIVRRSEWSGNLTDQSEEGVEIVHAQSKI